jgi:SAM-dependent methyltransferase
MRKSQSLDADYFEALYQVAEDPWEFATSAYEAEIYCDTIAALGEERAQVALEMGCSIGVLTQALAPLCDRLVSTELSPTGLERARRRCADLTNVRFQLARNVTDGLEEPLDLIVLSEVVYYWDDHDAALVGAGINRWLNPGGRVLLVHWLGETDYPKTADDAVATLFGLTRSLSIERQSRREAYRLDLWRRLGSDQARRMRT